MTSNTVFTIGTPATIVGATVSALVYTALVTTGDITAAVTGSGIELTGNVLSYGTELIAGSIAGTTVRTVAHIYGETARPAIRNTSRLGALGFAAIAGTGSALLTNAVIYSGKQISSYLYSYIQEYKQNTRENNDFEIEMVEDDIQLIKED